MRRLARQHLAQIKAHLSRLQGRLRQKPEAAVCAGMVQAQVHGGTTGTGKQE